MRMGIRNIWGGYYSWWANRGFFAGSLSVDDGGDDDHNCNDDNGDSEDHVENSNQSNNYRR